MRPPGICNSPRTWLSLDLYKPMNRGVMTNRMPHTDKPLIVRALRIAGFALVAPVAAFWIPPFFDMVSRLPGDAVASRRSYAMRWGCFAGSSRSSCRFWMTPRLIQSSFVGA